METMATDYRLPGDRCAGKPSRAEPVELLASQFDRFYRTVLGYLLHRLFDRELAEELTAETLYRAVRFRTQLPGQPRQIQVWLLRTATNLANTHYRRTRWRQRLLERFWRSKPTPPDDDPASDSPEEQRLARVRGVVKDLPPKLQAVVVLRYYLRMPYQDIAEILGCSQATARVRLSLAIREMRRRLGVPES